MEIRRNAHTLKGSAGIIGLKKLSEVAHRVEDLLDYLAENEIDGNEKIFELLLTSTDCFEAWRTAKIPNSLTEKLPVFIQILMRLWLHFKRKLNKFPNSPK